MQPQHISEAGALLANQTGWRAALFASHPWSLQLAFASVYNDHAVALADAVVQASALRKARAAAAETAGASTADQQFACSVS
jgi:hypothetical protein